jgi:hypothetical protein
LRGSCTETDGRTVLYEEEGSRAYEKTESTKKEIKNSYILGIPVLRSFSVAKGIRVGKYCVWPIFADTGARN